MADMPNGNCHQEKRIQLNLCQANMATSSASKQRLRGKFKSSSQELRKFQFCVIILGNPSKPQKHTVINSTLRSVVSGDKDVYIMGDFNIDLLKCESSQISQDFLLSLRSCYLIPTVDKATSVHRTSATLIDDTLTILTHSSQAETLFLILVIIFRSSVSQRQRKINFNKA